MDRVFLGANVLFSAAYRSDTRLILLWQIEGVRLVTSKYAVDEARRNLAISRPETIGRLDDLIGGCELTDEAAVSEINLVKVDIAQKDKPILLSAIHAKATHLRTGDGKHFGALFGERVRGVLVLRPADYLNSKQVDDREID
jgi:predicted nucleic acid-binding protein